VGKGEGSEGGGIVGEGGGVEGGGIVGEGGGSEGGEGEGGGGEGGGGGGGKGVSGGMSGGSGDGPGTMAEPATTLVREVTPNWRKAASCAVVALMRRVAIAEAMAEVAARIRTPTTTDPAETVVTTRSEVTPRPIKAARRERKRASL